MEPRATGLPNWRVVSWFPALLAIGAAVLVVFNISGSSSGAHWAYFGQGADPNLLLGNPLGIRSDEWLVHQAWVISQAQQGFPIINQTLPGGMDVTVALETPVWEWTALFRPHIWGYLLFGVDAGLAWEWWIPAFALVVGCYLLVVTYLPQHPISAALIACGTFFTPIFQWWYGTSALYPAAWGFLALAATRWLLRDPRWGVRIAWAALVGWFAVSMVLGLYAPFIIPVVIVFLACFVGSITNERTQRNVAWRSLLGRITPLIVAGVTAVVVFVLWLLGRLHTIHVVGATVYPGQRSNVTGRLLERDPFMTWFGGAAWEQYLQYDHGETALGPNASEAASVILFALFMVPGLIYAVVRERKRRGITDWLIIAILGVIVLFLVYLLVPGWDAGARLLLLDKVPMQRIWIAFAVLWPLCLVLIVRMVERSDRRVSRWLPWGTAAGVVFVHGLMLWRIAAVQPEVITTATLWPFTIAGIVVACFCIYLRRGLPIVAVCFVIVSVLIGARVNPLYVGAFDLRETQIGQSIAEIDAAAPGAWLGVGTQEVMALLVESGVKAYAGVQIYPPEELWSGVDPDGEYEDSWNRLGHIQWVYGEGEPVLTVPQVDVIRSTFDACSTFAQDSVEYLLTDQEPPSMDCMRLVTTVREANITFWIYAL